MDIAQQLLTTFNNDLNLFKKIITGDESWVYDYGIETKVQSSQWKLPEQPIPEEAHQVRSNVKVLLTVFFIAMTWRIMNSCHKVVLSIKNTTLKLCVDCAKQLIRNAQNCGKTNNGFCTIIMHQLTHRCLCVSFWPNTKP